MNTKNNIAVILDRINSLKSQLQEYAYDLQEECKDALAESLQDYIDALDLAECLLDSETDILTEHWNA